MKGLADSADVNRAAQAALTHWKERYYARKDKWIAGMAENTYGWFVKKKVGIEEATKLFEDSSFFDDFHGYCGASSGVFWIEFSHMEIAANLLALTQQNNPNQIILEQKEIVTLDGFWDA